jgi:protein-disulfide isomerase
MSDLRFPIDDHDHVIGSSGAPVTLVEYGDYQCPHCQAAWPEVEQVLRRYGNNLRYAYRHFPIWTMHPLAKPAAETAEFASHHRRFWDMHSALFANGPRLSRAILLALASERGLKPAELAVALDQHDYAHKVDADMLGGVRSGVNGTPCFFINGARHNGTYDAATLSMAIGLAANGGPSNVIGLSVA